ncbi:MAG: type II toxin-antitoxin system toxin DNA ADP-ribosyl transferase DarT [Nitrospirota bacterium]
MTAIYHITHIDNLQRIFESGGLHCDATMCSNGVECVGIAHNHIKERRARTIVPILPGGTLADYVPFYFAPRSPMLYSIHTGYVAGYEGGQESVLHLVSSAEAVNEQRLKFVFTNGHAVIAFSNFFNDLDDLDKIDWAIMKATYWNDTDADNDRKRRRQAEFLVHEFFPWELIEKIGVINENMARKVKSALAGCAHKPVVTVQQKWYY